MKESQEFKLKDKLVKFFRTNFTYYGLTEKAKEDRIYMLADDMFRIIVSLEGPAPEKLPTHIS